MARKKSDEGAVLEVPKTDPVEASKELKEDKPRASKSEGLADVLKERVEILTAQVQGFERLQERVKGLEQDLVDISNVLSLTFGEPIKTKLSGIVVRQVGRR